MRRGLPHSLSILSCAGGTDYAIGDFLAGQPLPIASRGAGSAGERVASARAHVSARATVVCEVIAGLTSPCGLCVACGGHLQ